MRRVARFIVQKPTLRGYDAMLLAVKCSGAPTFIRGRQNHALHGHLKKSMHCRATMRLLDNKRLLDAKKISKKPIIKLASDPDGPSAHDCEMAKRA